MLINCSTRVTGLNVMLVPYRKVHVEKYHKWMQSKELQHLTASEPLTLEQEYEMQQSWMQDEDKCTFIILDRQIFDKTQNEIEAMIGDTNLFFANDVDRMVAEAEIMIAEPEARGKHMGREATLLMLLYGIIHLKVKEFIVKITHDNIVSINLFQKIGFAITSTNNVFKEVTLSNECDSKEVIIVPYSHQVKSTNQKISVIGFGSVGQAVVAGLLLKKVTSHVSVTDPFINEGVLQDFRFASSYLNDATIEGDKDFQITCNSSIVIVTAGARPKTGGSRIDVLNDNIKIMKAVIPSVMKYSSCPIIIMISNPVDVLTWAAVKLSGLPKHRVIGSGTNLDSARLRYLLCGIYDVGCISCGGWILGEHGNSSAPMYSSFTVGNTYLTQYNPGMGKKNDPEGWESIYESVKTGGGTVHRFKGYTNWAIAFSVVDIVDTILSDARRVHAVTVCAQGCYKFCEDVYLSLPAVLCSGGVADIVTLNLPEEELNRLKLSADYLLSIQQQAEL